MRCLTCKYDLRKLADHRCPECGRPFDPDDMTSFYSSGDWVPVAIWIAFPLALILLVLLVLFLPLLL